MATAVQTDCVSSTDCQSIERTLESLQYYDSLQSTEDELENVLMEYCTVKNHHLIDDFNHILKKHQHEMENVYAIYDQSSSNLCSIASCKFYSRSHRNRDIEEAKQQSNDKDSQFIFWRDLLDQIHCFMKHLFDGGLRVRKQELYNTHMIYNAFVDSDDIMESFNDNECVDNSVDNERYNSCVDVEFQKLRQLTHTKRQTLVKLGVIDSTRNAHKFNIDIGYIGSNAYNYNQICRDIKTSDSTFMEGLLIFLRNTETQELTKLSNFLHDEEYDTESLQRDVETEGKTNSNIANVLESAEYVEIYIEEMERLTQEQKRAEERKAKAHKDTGVKIWRIAQDIMQPYYDELEAESVKTSSAFSIGYTFFYWNYYRYNDLKQQWIGNQNDLLGYSASQLYINKKYKSLKEELWTNNIYKISAEMYNNIYIKAQNYLKCSLAKSTCAADEEHELHYGIAPGTILSIHHLLSLLFYTDLSKLSAAFSSTFRTNKKNETLSSIKARNREYWHWSKLIRETVQYFGDALGHERGKPFFTGISYMMLPSLVIRLCSPTSTTKQKEIALNFAHGAGIVMQINNGSNYYSQFLRYFNCSWLSCYNSEDERIFCGGDCPIRVETVILVSGSKNLYWFMRSIFYLDCMVSGVMISPNSTAAQSIKRRDYRILQSLMCHFLEKQKNDFLEYVNNTFETFCTHKKQLIFNIDDINTYLLLLKNLVFDEESWNVVDLELVTKLFPQCEFIVICDEVNQCVFNLDRLLSIATKILNSSDNKLISIKVQVFRENNGIKDSWLHLRMKEKRLITNTDIRQTYMERQKGWDVLLLRRKSQHSILHNVRFSI